MVGHRLQGKLLRVLPFRGTAQMRHQHHFGSRLQGVLDGGQGRADTRIAGDLAVLHRHVQVFPDENALACQIQVGHAFEVHVVLTSFTATRMGASIHSSLM